MQLQSDRVLQIIKEQVLTALYVLFECCYLT